MSIKKAIGHGITKGINSFFNFYESDGHGGKWSDCDKHNPWDI